MPRRVTLLESAMARSLADLSPKVAVGIAVLSTLAGVAYAVVAARAGEDVDRAAPLVAGLLGWGAGVFFCFAASMRAFDRDREDGWAALLLRHGAGPRAYLAARTSAMVVVTLALVGIGTLVAGLAAVVASPDGRTVVHALRGLVAGLAYAAAFACVVAPIAVATLAPRGRAAGYVFLLLVLIVPALVSPWTGAFVPDDWRELVSVPGALDALRASLLGAVDAPRLVRAMAVLIGVVGLCVAWARAQLALRLSSYAADRLG
jgi:hypothetical protein